MRHPKYTKTDRVRPAKGLYSSFICIIDDIYYDEESDEFIYAIHTMSSPSVPHYFSESELLWAGLEI